MVAYESRGCRRRYFVVASHRDDITLPEWSVFSLSLQNPVAPRCGGSFHTSEVRDSPLRHTTTRSHRRCLHLCWERPRTTAKSRRDRRRMHQPVRTVRYLVYPGRRLRSSSLSSSLPLSHHTHESTAVERRARVTRMVRCVGYNAAALGLTCCIINIRSLSSPFINTKSPSTK